MAATRDITIYQGDTYIHELRLKNSSNTAINISGRTYSGQIRKRRTSDTSSAVFSSQITNAAEGVVLMSLTSEQTTSLRSGTYVYDFQELNANTVTTLITGTVTVIGQVTQ